MSIQDRLKVFLSDTSRTFARTPRKFALKDWKNALLETKAAVGSKDATILSAGIAYFLTFAVFPGIAALVGILSFVIAPEDLMRAVEVLNTFLPESIAYLVSTQLAAALESPSSSAFVVAFGLAIALFSLSGAMSNVIKAVNRMYGVRDDRSFIKLRGIGALFIFAAGAVTVIVVGLLLLNERILLGWDWPAWLAWGVLVLRWVVVAAIVTFGLAAFYRYAPNRRNPYWQWVTWGSLIATVIWLLGTALFFLYARFFAHYTESYSVFAGIIVLMIWLNLTALAVLVGASINHKLESQTRAKTTH